MISDRRKRLFMFQNSKQSVYKVCERRENLKSAKTEFNLGFDALKTPNFVQICKY